MDIESLQGQNFGQFELRDLLGKGGMSAVYRGYQAVMGRDVAIKVLSPELRNQNDYLERFRYEAKIMARLEHLHIVSVYDFGTSGDISYLVMRLLTGGTLEERIRKKESFSAETVSSILKQLCQALDYAHQQGIIHRDIKASNILFDGQGNCYLSDFGIAKLLNVSNKLTITGQMIGTPHYMAPEQWSDGELSPATDIYALGVLAYLLFFGQLPFEASNPLQLLQKHMQEDVRFSEGSPAAVKDCLRKALAKNPAERYSKAGDFAAAFQAAIAGIPPTIPQPIIHSPEEFSSVIKPSTELITPLIKVETAAAPPPRSASGEAWTRGALLLLALLVFFMVLIQLGIIQIPEAVSSATNTASASPSASHTPSRTPRPSNTARPTISRTPSPSHTRTARPSNTARPTISRTPSPSHTRTPRPSNTALPTVETSLIRIEGEVTNRRTSHEFYWYAGDIISIELSSNEPDFDPQFSLMSPSDTLFLFSDDCSGTLNACTTSVAIEETGWHALIVRGFDEEMQGGYTLSINYRVACSYEAPIAIVSNDNINLRAGAGASFRSIARLNTDDCLVVLGRNANGTWLFVETEGRQEGWVNASLVQIFDELLMIPTASP